MNVVSKRPAKSQENVDRESTGIHHENSNPNNSSHTSVNFTGMLDVFLLLHLYSRFMAQCGMACLSEINILAIILRSQTCSSNSSVAWIITKRYILFVLLIFVCFIIFHKLNS